MDLKFVIPDIKEIQKREVEEERFAKGLNFYKLFWIFFIGCVLGVIIETLWCIFTNYRIESRVALIYGPFNPVYGIGALAMALGLNWMQARRDIFILIGGAIIGSVVEFACSWVQEMAFGTISWDYSSYPLNLFGRINLLGALCWGILGVLWIKVMYPFLASWILKIPNRIGKGLTWALTVFMIFNIIMSGLAVQRWTMRVQGGTPETSGIWGFFDKRYPDSKLERIYPNMVFPENKDA